MRRARTLFVGLAMLGALLLMGASVATAQTAPPVDSTPHPTHIHEGTCANLNPNPQYPLNETTVRKASGNSTPTPPTVEGVQQVPTVLYSNTQVDVSLDDLLKSPHAINVHKSDADIQTYIACGNIGGPVIEDELDIALYPQNDSGYMGVAVLKRDGSKTNVTVYLVPPSSAASAVPATPGASPAATPMS